MKVKQVPEDFAVSELIDLKVAEAGNETYFWLTKRNWTTERAINEIARRCGVSYRRFKFAGTKDKFAVTKQAVSAFKVPAEKLKQVEIKDISIEVIGLGENPISLGTLSGNHFEIIIRDLSKDDIKTLKKNLSKIKKSGFRNLFGEQRFGKGNTHLIGKEILRGYLENAVKQMICFSGDKESKEKLEFENFAKENWGDWEKILGNMPYGKGFDLERQVLFWLTKNKGDFAGALRTLPKHIRKLYVHAYQSLLWNHAVLKQTNFMKKYAPVPGFETKLGKDSFSNLIRRSLENENLFLESFRCSRMPELAVEGESRKVMVKPTNLNIGDAGDDELNPGKNKVKLSFDLAKGSYATVLLDALFKDKIA
ncbi:MAG: tRNA pseudouridine(13) synthase TruD [DPANN group archaeon]|nr:tRNA pseudouridine(13) synthase TruD [DPANN group archaeon]